MVESPSCILYRDCSFSGAACFTIPNCMIGEGKLYCCGSVSWFSVLYDYSHPYEFFNQCGVLWCRIGRECPLYTKCVLPIASHSFDPHSFLSWSPHVFFFVLNYHFRHALLLNIFVAPRIFPPKLCFCCFNFVAEFWRSNSIERTCWLIWSLEYPLERRLQL